MITRMFGIGRTHFVDLMRMSNERKNEISGILLAGGKASRMGGVTKEPSFLEVERLQPWSLNGCSPKLIPYSLAPMTLRPNLILTVILCSRMFVRISGSLSRNRNYLKTELRRSLVFRLTDRYPVSTEKSGRTSA